MADRCQILTRDKSLLLPIKLDEAVPSVINRVRFHEQAPCHIKIMNAERNAKGAITAITHQNTTAAMALLYHNTIISAVRMADKEVVDVKVNESWQGLTIHSVPLTRYMGKATEGHLKMGEEFQAMKQGMVIPSTVRWQANPCTNPERRLNR